MLHLLTHFGSLAIMVNHKFRQFTDFLFQDGNIVAIGGLMKQEQSSEGSGLPGASRSQGIGWLFGNKSSYLAKRELVILIKPTIIRNDSSWKDDLAETQERLEQYDPRRLVPQAQAQ